MFSYVLLDIYPGLFFAVVFYSIFGTIITMYIGKYLQILYYNKIQYEANFRFNIIRIRENCESIAFYDDNALLEYTNIWRLFNYIYNIQLNIINKQLHLEIFTKSYEYFAFVIPMYVIAPLYFKGQIGKYFYLTKFRLPLGHLNAIMYVYIYVCIKYICMYIIYVYV